MDLLFGSCASTIWIINVSIMVSLHDEFNTRLL